MSVNLFDLAGGNAASLRQRFLDLITAQPDQPRKDALIQFESHVQNNGRVTINLRLSDAAMLLTDRHHNIHEWAANQEARYGRPAADILRERLGDWYDRRIAFDGHFDNGDHFRYGALNCGGLGTSQYGDCCAVIAEEKWETCVVAYLEADSLRTYMTTGPAVDEPALAAACSPPQQRGTLAAMKHATAIAACPAAGWAKLVCSSTGYVEAIFVGDLLPAELESMRIAKTTYETYAYFAVNDLAGRRSEDERNLMAHFNIVVDRLETLGITLESCDA